MTQTKEMTQIRPEVASSDQTTRVHLSCEQVMNANPIETLSHSVSKADTRFAAGSLSWQVERLQRGESLIKDDTGEAMRRACSRAVAAVRIYLPERTYEISVWYAVL